MMKEELEADGGSAIEGDGISMGVGPRTEPGWVDEEKRGKRNGEKEG